VNRIATLGKPVYIAESSYPASPVAGTYPAIPDFPYTDAGQAVYLDSQMRWASNNPNIIGWAWFYPEWYPGINGNDDVPVLQVSGLFSDAQTLRPAAAALNFAALPGVEVTVNGTAFRPGQVLTLGVTARSGLATPEAFLLGVLLPDGQTAVLFSSAGAVTFSGTVANLSALPTEAVSPGFSLNNPRFIQFTFPPRGIPAGTYQVFAVFLQQGALANNQIDPGDVLAADIKAFTFTE